MYITIQNDNYGYSVSTENKWLAVGNPSFNSWPQPTASIPTSGSVDLFLYNKKNDLHEFREIFHKHLSPEEEILLATEIDDILHTELTGSVPLTADLDLAIDYGLYLTASINDYGRSVDLHKNLLGIGFTRNRMLFKFASGSINYTGSGGVDVYNIGRYDINNVSATGNITEKSSLVSGSYYFSELNIPSGYNKTTIQSKNLSDVSASWQAMQILNVDYINGGNYLFSFETSSLSASYRAIGYIEDDVYVSTIKNPHPEITESFGFSLSIGNDWMAIGSPQYSESKGAVYMYRKYGGPLLSNISWSLHQIITASDAQSGDLFGWSVEMNNSDGFVGYNTRSIAHSQSIVVGTNRPSGSKVYYYEISGSFGITGSQETGSIIGANWQEMFQFSPSYPIIPLTHYSVLNPILSGSYASNVPDRFGYDVSIYKDTIAIGAPLDRYYYEYASSSVYQQGAFYVFERCPTPEYGFYLKMKSNGNEKSLKNHRLGYSVDVYNDKLIVGSPKVTANVISLMDSGSGGSSITSCYVQGSLYQAHFCRTEDEYQIQGQFAYLQYNTNSLDWEYNNIYQIKKDYLSPYRNFGFSVDTDDKFIAVGSPMNMSGSQRVIDIYHTASKFDEIDSIAGQTYIYNHDNYRSEFHIGNVFYRNGKIVIVTSGSQFDSLFFNPISDNDYEYDLRFNNKQTLHEKQIICSVDPGEFNVSTNPTALQITSSLFDINRNGQFDFQDLDVLLMYMNYKRTEDSENQNTNWSSSLLSQDDEISWFNYLRQSGSFYGTPALYSSSFSWLNTTLVSNELDCNQDNIIDINDQNILWKYFSNRLNQKNFDKYITVNSNRRLFGDVIDYLNSRTLRSFSPMIKSDFFDYERLSKNDSTGSYLAPYVTSIGLYQNGDLVSVAKLGSPIKLLPDYPYNFVIKLDF